MNNVNLDSYGYLLSCPVEMADNVKATMKDGNAKINWNKFNVGDAFYTEDTYRCVTADHPMKRIVFITEEEYHEKFNMSIHEKRKQKENEIFNDFDIVYVTKAALKFGRIRVAILEYIDEEGFAHCILRSGKSKRYKNGEWFRSLEEAENAVKEIKNKKIKKLEMLTKSYDYEWKCLEKVNIVSETKYDIMDLCETIHNRTAKLIREYNNLGRK